MTPSDRPGTPESASSAAAGKATVPGSFLAILDCTEEEAEGHLGALKAMVHADGGAISITDVTSTCMVISMPVSSAMMPRIIAALKLAGATIMPPETLQDDRAIIVMTIWTQKQKEPE